MHMILITFDSTCNSGSIKPKLSYLLTWYSSTTFQYRCTPGIAVQQVNTDVHQV